MNIQQFQYVLAVAELRHFEQAANKCFVTQSTLSTMISKFEDEIGVKIFDRKKKPVTITKEGEFIVLNIKTIVHQINNLENTVKELKGEIEGKLKIAVIPTVAPYLLPLFLHDFATKYPLLQIEIKEQTTTNILKQLKNRDIDIGILSIPFQDPDLVETKLYDEPFLFFDANPQNKVVSVSPNSPIENLWLLEEGHCMRTQVVKLCDFDKSQLNSSLNVNFKAGSIDSLLRIVKANQGSTFIPYLASLDFTTEEKKLLKPFVTPIPIRTVGLVTHTYFVKKKIVDLLRKEILTKVKYLLPETKKQVYQLSPS